MEDFVMLGPFRIPIRWIVIGLSLLAAYVLISVRLRKTNFHRKLLLEVIFNGVFYGFIVWKISYVLFYPSYALSYPVGIIYFDGGFRGILLGIVIGLIYIYVQSSKQNVKFQYYAELLLIGWLATVNVYVIPLLADNVFYYSGQVFLSTLLIVLLLKSKEFQSEKILTVMFIYSLGQLFLQFFAHSTAIYFGFNSIQIFFILVALFLLVLQFKINEKH
ncbi:hypothetical protein [Halalkalibacter krulwichiae]|uniref:Prolipoprotein diacylglyceryl transferase n=1 Tax=Halalkalibacter krulwichiae TaxID=199441 RepID=A0A1X9MJU7_9BACI|nr:hypothetical protein [Halalkalibacter krulwichiae]ARK30882.1 prolipoprotein diacylglyceryl transferase [Halalkalibacter krulwichiae]